MLRGVFLPISGTGLDVLAFLFLVRFPILSYTEVSSVGW